jgi:nucleotide-binding universal stress UspA family protein
MEMSHTQRKILVPTDFSKVGDNALDHALTLAKHSDAEVYLMHIVSKVGEVEGARKKLDEIITKALSEAGEVKLHKLVRVGSIYEDIGDAAAEIDASLIVMGTHGMRGMQFLTGSRALRVITSSQVPFIVVQERSIKAGGYDSIVITPREDDEFLHKQLVNNIKFANQYLDERGISHDATIAEEDSNDFVKAVVRHAVKLDADLITIMNLAQGNIFGVLGVPYEQEILTNEAHIPVMCMNPRETSVGGGWTMQG